MWMALSAMFKKKKKRKENLLLRTMGNLWRFSEECAEIRSVFLNKHFDSVVKSGMERVPMGSKETRKGAIFGV